MIRVGITGQSGFVGTHLFSTLGLSPEKFKRIDFDDYYFSDNAKLTEFVSSCDVIVHLAALNRHKDPEIIFNTNVDLVQKLITVCNTADVKPHILFSSSTQEELNNLYGRSKKEGRERFENWAVSNNAKYTGFVIPNVFGPFGKPFHNSVVATFCYQLTHDQTPRVDNDSELKLIYVGELVSLIIKDIEAKFNNPFENNVDTILVPHSYVIKVSQLLGKLLDMKDNYITAGGLPDLNQIFDLHLFNTLLTFIDINTFFPYHLKLNTDHRGSFVETLKLKSGGQVSFSTTNPGITRGNHFHTRKAERFAVIKGDARIELRQIGTTNKISYTLSGKIPSFVDMPVWYTHNITNIGDEDLFTIFWINEFFDANDPDTFFEQV